MMVIAPSTSTSIPSMLIFFRLDMAFFLTAQCFKGRLQARQQARLWQWCCGGISLREMRQTAFRLTLQMLQINAAGTHRFALSSRKSSSQRRHAGSSWPRLQFRNPAFQRG
jgi:hypothetical protein